jgi:glycyl-tRNA synthetase beta chain
MTGRRDFLFELLTEEIPAWMILDRLAVLREKLREMIAIYEGQAPAEERIECDATSRRIWFLIRQLEEKQPDRVEEVKGPPERVAWDPDSDTPTRALEGFLRKNDATTDEIERRDGYVWLERKVEGESIEDFLAEQVPPLIEGLRWPKMMRWGAGEHSWIRPVHGVVAIYGDLVVPMRIFDVTSEAETEGHRTRGSGRVSLAFTDEYRDRLEEARVIVDSSRRVEMLRRKAIELANEVGGAPAEDASIWSQWAFLTEFPGVVRSEFREEYLALPEEVLTTVMRVHQKQLPILAGDALTRHFLSIIDADDDPQGLASTGNAFVTNARFADAMFFYEFDRKRSLGDRVDDLAHLQFQESLGNYREKTARITGIAEAIHAESGASSGIDDLREACILAKVDLLTEMVKEFTDLQGQIGGIYARLEGKSEPVWQAIYDHYLPQSMEDRLPRGQIGAIVSLADRLDTLAGFFLIGLRPTGSRDPFALRRAAQGLVRILFAEGEYRIPVAVDRLVEIAVDAQSGEHGTSREETRSAIVEFLEERVRTVLESEWGFAYDETAAGMAAGWTGSLPDLRNRLEALRRARSSGDFLSILDSAKRIANITPPGFSGSLERSLLEHEAEKRLAEITASVREQIEEMIREKKYDLALRSFAAMAPELETFFDQVLVNVEDAKVRDNRLALLQQVGSAVASIGDVTKIVVQRKSLESRE